MKKEINLILSLIYWTILLISLIFLCFNKNIITWMFASIFSAIMGQTEYIMYLIKNKKVEWMNYMKTKIWAVWMVLLCTILTSTAQVLYKNGAFKLSFNILELITNYWLIGGLALYGIGAVILIAGLKGGELSVLYPIIATSYIWVALYSIHFFGEEVNIMKWIGIFVIIAGIAFVGIGSKDKDIVEYTEAV